jgi:hypothetical protein
MSEFIFMLTHDDETVADALSIYKEIRDTGCHYVGFKDIGLPKDKLKELNRLMQEDGHKTMMEVVSLSEADERRSAESAIEIGVDYLIGGTRKELLKQTMEGSGIKLFPYIGNVVGHPARLEGTIESFVAEARETEDFGVDGINLLAYRYVGDAEELVKAVIDAVDIPVICAGSVRSVRQIETLRDMGVWGFTIGGAILEREIIPGGSLVEQIEATLQAAGGLAGSEADK